EGLAKNFKRVLVEGTSQRHMELPGVQHVWVTPSKEVFALSLCQGVVQSLCYLRFAGRCTETIEFADTVGGKIRENNTLFREDQSQEMPHSSNHQRRSQDDALPFHKSRKSLPKLG